jgi:hypothetical protein
MMPGKPPGDRERIYFHQFFRILFAQDERFWGHRLKHYVSTNREKKKESFNGFKTEG